MKHLSIKRYSHDPKTQVVINKPPQPKDVGACLNGSRTYTVSDSSLPVFRSG